MGKFASSDLRKASLVRFTTHAHPASSSHSSESDKKESAPPPAHTAIPLHSNSLVDRLIQLASAYNSPGDNDAIENAQKGFVSDLNKAKVVGEIRAEDKMLAGVMDSLAVKTSKNTDGERGGKDTEVEEAGKGKGKEV